MKIGFFELEGWETEFLKNRFSAHELFFSPLPIHQYFGEETSFDIVSVFVNSEINKNVLLRFPYLKFISARCTGYDNIDVEFCKERGISVSYVPGYGDNTVAEFAFGLLLNLTRKIYLAINSVKTGENFEVNKLRGIDLKGKTIGVIGTGRIGKEAIKIAKGFSMNVIAFDLFPNNEFATSMGFSYLSLEKLLSSVDIITLHAPLTKETKHLINNENINLIKKGAYLINTARGGLIETNALVYALQNGILAGAALDVLEEENQIKDEMNFFKTDSSHFEQMKILLENHLLMRMPNVLITPHNAFNSKEALERILKTTMENIEGFLLEKPVNTISC